jgi:hypothetical protein
MKKQVLLILFIALAVWAQDKSQVTVKTATTSNGLELQCTAEQAWCNAVKAGDYQMVRLPKNHGMYDCQNVDLFPSGADVENDQKLGEYCLNDAS